jgi:peptidoglycan/LPS O-acetylase OafA/YrhL
LTSRLAILGGKSFGVYLIHAPALEITARLVYHLLPVLLAFQAGFLILLVALALGFPLLLMAAVNRSPASPVYKYIFG